MTTSGRPFCWPCRHYRPPEGAPGAIDGEWSAGTCAAFPDGIPSIIAAGGFDHREPHPDDGNVRFERNAEIDWDEQQVTEFLDLQLRRFNQRQRQKKALR